MREQALRQAAIPIINAMTVDVEDYFQVQALAEQFPRSIWDKQSAGVERNTDRVLSLFADHGVKATFFTLGWVAERHRSLIYRIVESGHELASHGYEHIRADQQDRNAFRADIRRTKRILEDLSGGDVRGYRAATFSIGKGICGRLRSWPKRDMPTAPAFIRSGMITTECQTHRGFRFVH